MYPNPWGLKTPPFCRGLDPHFFYASPMHEEALARLHFLVENRRRLGWMTGPAGSGKSLLLTVFAEQLRRRGAAVSQMNLPGRDVAEVLWQLAADWGANPSPTTAPVVLWRMLEDRLLAHRWQQLDTVFLLDDAEGVSDPVTVALLRLMQFDESPESRLTVVLAGRQERLTPLSRRLGELTELRIDLEPWEQPDTEKFLNHSLHQAGQSAPLFSESAMARLHALTDGNPRRVSRLAELTLVAGAGEELNQIDADVVESVSRELCGAEK
ncbi:MAG: AAA family ATPase [Pirellulales bacterium]|nr:AAA family ATPase [Pirellulales bacterium]